LQVDTLISVLDDRYVCGGPKPKLRSSYVMRTVET
jgi:hypothetical protein